MALIKLTVSELEGVQSQISKMSSKASDCANKVSSVRNGLDMEITAKRNIEERLDNIKRDLTKHSEALKLHANILNDVINEFVKTDSSGSQSTVSLSNWKNGAIAGGVFAVGGVLGGISTLGKHTGQMYDWKTQQQLGKISSVGSMFGISSCLMTSVPKGTESTGESVKVPVEDAWDTIKTGKKAASLYDTLVSVFNKGEIPDFIKNKSGYAFSKDFFKGFGYISDAEKAINAVIDSDIDALTELLGKYGIKNPLKEIVETTVGGASAEVGLLTDLIYSDFESAIDVSKEIATEFTNVISNPDSNIMDYAKVIGELYRAPDKIITQGFINVVGDYADNIGGVLDSIGIVDAPEEGYIDFYKNAFADVKDMFNTFGATVDTMASIGKGISGFFKDLI